MTYRKFKQYINHWKRFPTTISETMSIEEKEIYRKINKVPQDKFQKYITRWIKEESKKSYRINERKSA